MVLPAFPTRNGIPPRRDDGPKWLELLPFVFSSSIVSLTVDLNKELLGNSIDQAQSIWVDNSNNARSLMISVTGSNQVLLVPAGAQATLPLATAEKTAILTFSTTGQGTVFAWVSNFKHDYAVWGGTGNGLINDASGTYSGSDQTVLPLRPNRLGLIIQNQGAAVAAVNFSAAAVLGGAGSINLAASGGQLILYGGACPCDPVHIIGTATQNFTVKEIF